MLARLIAKIENTQISFFEAIFGFVGVLCLRFFLENFSSPTPSFPAAPDILTLVHYALFYVAVFFSLILVLRIFIPDIAKISKFLLLGLPVIWLPPIIDLIRSNGTGALMAYIFNSGNPLLNDFFNLGGSSFGGGITTGIKIEIASILIVLFVYVLEKTRSLWRSLLASFCAYIAIFFWVALPSFIAFFGSFFASASGVTVSYFLLQHFSAARSIQNFIRPSVEFSYLYAAETVFNLGMAYFYYILNFLLLAGWFFLYKPKAARAILKNCRPERVTHYFIMIFVGIFAAMKIENASMFGGGIDLMALVTLLLSFFCAWLFAVGVNDIADVEIDSISNKDRPLITHDISEEEIKNLSLFFLGWALLGAYLGGYWTLFMMVVYIAMYYIYSAPPFRLKRVPIFSTFLISVACLSATMAGFYFVSPNRFLSAFPRYMILVIIICFTLAANIKDIKDIDGDAADGIPTIPVIFGKQLGKTIIGALLAISFLAIPIIFAANDLFLPSLIAAIVGYILVVREDYKEWRIFTLYFAYAAIGGLIALSTR